MSGATRGKIQYTARAFQQDGEAAIRGDIVRAAIELITNSDDAYETGQSGPIVIQLIHQPKDSNFKYELSVRDSASGMSADTMEKKLTKVGGSNEDFQAGAEVRGLLGRGAKDVASLGKVTFESIRDDKYSLLWIDSQGDWEFESKDLAATGEHRASIGIGEGQNGTKVTIHCTKVIPLPNKGNIQRKLSSHIQLRELLVRREVSFQDSREKNLLTRLNPPENIGELLMDETIAIPDFDTTVQLKLFKFHAISTGSVDEYSRHGVYIKSGVTIYQNSLFGFEGHSQAGWIFGTLDCSLINKLIRDYDDGLVTDKNNIRLVSRDRDGLEATHKFTKSMRLEVQKVLKPVLDELQSKHGVGEAQGDELKRAFDNAKRALQSEITDVLREIEEEIKGDIDGTDLANIAVIPPQLKLPKGSIQTISVRIKPEFQDALVVNLAESESEPLCFIVNSNTTEWTQHERLPVLHSTFKITAGDDLGATLVYIEVGGLKTQLPITIIEKPTIPVELPTTLDFKHNVASIAPTRTRKLELIAPIDYLDREIFITASGERVENHPEKVTLKSEPGGRWAMATVPVKAGEKLGVVNIHAQTKTGESADAELTISDNVPLGGFDLKFVLKSGKNVSWRTATSSSADGLEVEIFGDHPGFSGVFGIWNPATREFAAQDSPQARSALSEVIARALAQHFVTLQSLKHPDDFTDAARYFARADELATRFAKATYLSFQVSS